MAEFVLEAEARVITGKKVSQLRNAGLVPVTVYGPKIEPINLQIPYRNLERMLLKAGGTNLIDLTVDGKVHIVLAREVQRDVLKGKILHADFFSVDAASKIRYAIPVHLIGESPAIASKRGIMLTGTQTITVETLPGKLLHGIDVDISGMTEIGSTIVVGDIKMPADVVVIDDPEEMVFRITQTSAQRAEEEIEAGANSSEPEIIQKGKLEDE
ncbi:MAG: 50S ribosomal protein L25 [Phototrophicales bacterium]|nr:50S ribosomal protein L25 [Phototrophicales bacterium]